MDVPRKHTTKHLIWAAKQKYYLPIRDRIRIIILAIRGKTIKEIANQMECSGRTVQKWVARYRINGIDSLWDKPRSGAPRKLAEEFEEEFIKRIFDGPLEEDGVSIFNGLKIREILEKEFGAKYTLDGVYALLKRLKLTWVTSRPIHEKNDPVKMAEWKAWFKSEVKKKRKRTHKKIEIWFQDEARIGQKGNLYRIWTKKGCRKRIIKQLGFKSAHLFGAVCPETGQRVGLVFETLDTETVNLHLQLIRKSIPKNVHVVLVWDQAGFHTSNDIVVPRNITIINQAAYSPELNPVERVWKYLKTHFLGNRVFKDMTDILTASVDAWNKLSAPLIRSICRTSWLE